MNAQHVLDLITVYRELTLAEQRQVQNHTAWCASCALALAQAQRVDRLVQSLPPARHTPGQDAVLRRRVFTNRPIPSHRVSSRSRFSQLAWLVIAVLIVAILSGTGAAAAHSLPDTPLYPLKLAAEQARGWLIWDATAQAEWQLARARARLDEINLLVGQGRPPSRQALARLQNQLASALASTARAPLPDTLRLLQQAGGLTGDALARLSAWQEQAPTLPPDDLEDLRRSLRQQQSAIDAGLAAPEQFRQTPTPTGRAPRRVSATVTPVPTQTPTATSTNAAPCDSACDSTAMPTPLPTRSPRPTATAATPPLPTATPPPAPTVTPTASATPTPRPGGLPPRPPIAPSRTPRPPRPPPPTHTALPPLPSTTPTAVNTPTEPTPTITPTGNHILPPRGTRTPPPRRTPPPGWTPRARPTPVAAGTVTAR